MTEQQIRNQVVAAATAWLGAREGDSRHRKIIDTYNSQKPLPVGVKLGYHTDWCAAFVSVVGIEAGLSDILFPECSCGRMIALYQKAGRWMENDSYKPSPGDIVMYDWQDSGVGDNLGWPDHVGMVAAVSGNRMTVIEGNNGDAVAYRTMAVGGTYIRGYCLPDYASKATGAKPAANPALASARATVQRKAGLSDATMDYLAGYRYGSDLLAKLAKAMQ